MKDAPENPVEMIESSEEELYEKEKSIPEKSSSSEEEEDSDIEPNIFDMNKVAKKVSWGAPLQESDVSDDSSNGVNIYARAAEKEVSKEKKKKKADKKKCAKESFFH